MSHELTVQTYALMVLDEEPLDLLSRTLEAKVHATDKEVEDLTNMMQAEHHWVGKALHAHAYEFPELAGMLRARLNEMAELNQAPKVPDGVDPISQRREDGSKVEEIQKFIDDKNAVEERQMEQMKASRDGIKLRAECTKMFRRISRKCHPDRTRDKSLWPVFDTAKKAFDDWNLQMLQGIWRDVEHYIKVRSKNLDFQAYLNKLLEFKTKYLSDLLVQRAQFHDTLEYQAYKARSSVVKAKRYRAYKKVIDGQVEKLDMAIAQRKAQLQQQSRTFYFTTNTTGFSSTTTTFR